MGNLDFFELISKLKTTKRTGWINHGIKNPESIADHMYRMGIMAMVIDDNLINRERLIQMSIVHDLAESIVGDFTPDDPITKEEKAALELKAIDQIVVILDNSKQAKYIKELWMEYEECITPESQLCKDLDKLEMIIQAFEYEKSDKRRLDSFFESTKDKFKHPEIVNIVKDLYSKRSDYWNSLL